MKYEFANIDIKKKENKEFDNKVEFFLKRFSKGFLITFILLLIFTAFIHSVSAGQIGIDLIPTSSTSNIVVYSNASANMTNYWDALDTYNATQFDAGDGVTLNIKQSWLSTFIHSIIDAIFTEVSTNVSSANNRISSINSTIISSNASWLSTYNSTYALFNDTTRINAVNTTFNIQSLLNATGIYSTYNVTYAGYPQTINGTINSIAWNRTGTNVYLAKTGDKVGIGTTGPSQKLEVNGNIALDKLISNGVTVLDFVSASNVFRFGAIDYNSSISLNTNGAERVRIDTSGNVGIGTTSPNYKLEVNGSINVLNTTGTNSFFFVNGTTGRVGIGDITPEYNLDVEGTFAVSGVANFGSGVIFEGSDIQHSTDGGVFYAGNGVSDEYYFKSHDGSGWDTAIELLNGSVFLALNGGNVGIGTTGPLYPLTVAKNTSEANQSVSIWAVGNISALGFIDRTSVFDKTKSLSAFNYIQDSDYYKIDGKIDHKKFYGYADLGQVPDYMNPIITTNIMKICSDVFNETTNLTIKECHNETTSETTYNLIHEEGVDLGKEISVLRQALYEQKVINDKYTNCLLTSNDFKIYKECVLK